MNLANQPSDSNSNLLFVNFNQDYTSLAVGTKTSYRLFSLTSVDKLEQIYEHDSEDICIVERLFSSSLVAVVSLTAPRKLKVCHFKKGTEICNYSYSNTILAVKLNRKRLIVALEESLYVHNIRDMKVLHTIRDTPPNPHGLCALSISNDNCYLAYPGSSQIGEVQIFDTVNLQAVTMISAHNSPLAALAFDTSGTKLATASEKAPELDFIFKSGLNPFNLGGFFQLFQPEGTVIRVFSIPDGKKLFEFRRGVKRCVSINSLAFSADSIFLCASSNTETVHIFKLEQPKEKPAEEPSTWMGYLGKALMTPANYLPSQVTEVLTQDRAFAIVKLPFSGLKNVCALANVATIDRLDISLPITESISKPRVLVAAADGFLYIYNLDPTDGGDCTLLKQHRLDGQADSGSGGLVGATAGGSAGGEGAAAGAGGAGSEEQSEGAEAKGGGEQAALGYSPAPAKTFASATGGSRNVDLLSSSPHRSPVREPILPSTVDHRHDELLVTADADDNQFSSPGMAAGLNQLRLDDDNEFPPMMQHTE